MLVLTILAAFVVVGLLSTRWLPVHSDEGPGTEEGAFDSPLLIWKYPYGDPAFLAEGPSTPGDLLTNGDMDQMGFYWRYPNHWIAGGWFEWFSTALRIPEFTDGHLRSFVHTHPSSQRLQLWGSSYAGGLIQSVTVAPCTHYRFQAYGQSRPGANDPPPVDVTSHMKVGIEPYGWMPAGMSGRSIPKYNPGLEPSQFPAAVVWSPEATHNFVFQPYSTTTEALSNTLTVILFSNPEVDPEGGVWWNDTVWDTASLVEVAPPSGTLLGDDDLPAPDGQITNLRATALPFMAVVEWDTLEEASSQLRYRVTERSAPITVTDSLTYTLYLPLLTTTIDQSALNSYSSPDFTPVRHHRVVLTGLPERYNLDFVALSRRLDGKACITSASSLLHTNSPDDGSVIYLPTLLRGK